MKAAAVVCAALVVGLVAGQAQEEPSAAEKQLKHVQRARSKLFQAHEHAKELVDVAIEQHDAAVEREDEIRRLLTEAMQSHGASTTSGSEVAEEKAASTVSAYSQYSQATRGAWSVREILARLEDESALVLAEQAEALEDELRVLRKKLAEQLANATMHAVAAEKAVQDESGQPLLDAATLEDLGEHESKMALSFTASHRAYRLLERAVKLRQKIEDLRAEIEDAIEREGEARDLVPFDDCVAHMLDSEKRVGEVHGDLAVQQEYICRALTTHKMNSFDAVREEVKTAEVKQGSRGVCVMVKQLYSLDAHPDAAQRSCKRMRVLVGEVVQLARYRKYLRTFKCAAGGAKNETCNGNGVCRGEKCFCRPGWTAADCGIKTCPDGCSGHGFCNRGSCRCEDGWTGETCESRDCPMVGEDRCGMHGECQKDNSTGSFSCLCEPGYKGPACQQRVCPFGRKYQFECSGRGRCLAGGKCDCFRGFAGDACQHRRVEHGYCNKRGGCVCDKGWNGAACDLMECPLACSGDNGVCDGFTGKCLCKRGWRGDGCQYVDPQCPLTEEERAEDARANATGLLNRPMHHKPCSARGLCKPKVEGEHEGECVCPPGWVGPSCQYPDCPGQRCFNERHGKCVHDGEGRNSRCECFTGYDGEDCSEKLDVPVPCGQECFTSCLHVPQCNVPRAEGEHNRNAHLYSEKRSRAEQEALDRLLVLDLPATAGISRGKMNTCFLACAHQCVAERCWQRGHEFAKSAK